MTKIVAHPKIGSMKRLIACIPLVILAIAVD
jgi:hypothetical protein